jgi:nucleotide-binding universal stress UspA family protein
MAIEPEFMVKVGIPSDQILVASHALNADLIILGLGRRAHIGIAAHMPWDVAYKVVRGARCPVLTNGIEADYWTVPKVY